MLQGDLIEYGRKQRQNLAPILKSIFFWKKNQAKSGRREVGAY